MKFFLVLLLFLFSCRATRQSSVKSVSDIATMSSNSAGGFNVKCKDGSSEAVMPAQILADHVCQPNLGNGAYLGALNLGFYWPEHLHTTEKVERNKLSALPQFLGISYKIQQASDPLYFDATACDKELITASNGLSYCKSPDDLSMGKGASTHASAVSDLSALNGAAPLYVTVNDFSDDNTAHYRYVYGLSRLEALCQNGVTFGPVTKNNPSLLALVPFSLSAWGINISFFSCKSHISFPDSTKLPTPIANRFQSDWNIGSFFIWTGDPEPALDLHCLHRPFAPATPTCSGSFSNLVEINFATQGYDDDLKFALDMAKLAFRNLQ